jgi:hypothetical protein
MRIIAGIFVILAASVVSAIAQSPDVPEEEKTVKMVLYPAAEPRPALKYQLLPPFLERRPGNAAVWWNRIPAERNGFFNALYADDGPWDKAEKWMAIPIGDPREKEYRKKVLANSIGMFGPGGIFSDIERAAQFESCDWEQPIREGNYIAVTLPEIQGSRSYARLLSAKAHLEIAEGKYAEAVRTLQCGYAEARHVAQSQTLVSGLVGLAIASIMSNQVQQLIQQPDAPNLYWALSTLPRPPVDTRPGAEAESSMLYLQFPELRDLKKKKLSPDEWRALLKRTIDNIYGIGLVGGGPFPTKEASMAVFTLAAVQGYPRAKQYLIGQGRSAAEVEAMPVAQVVLLYTMEIYEELSDNQFKWFFLPASEANEGLARANRQMMKAFAANREIIPIARFFLPAILAAKHAEIRCEWTFAMLRIFEAMRLYAAAHDGQWPDRLSDISDVPIPANPVDGKPFVYQRQGNKAILTSQSGPRNVPWRHEITLMQKAK